jgi:hypothetical protein
MGSPSFGKVQWATCSSDTLGIIILSRGFSSIQGLRPRWRMLDASVDCFFPIRIYSIASLSSTGFVLDGLDERAIPASLTVDR